MSLRTSKEAKGAMVCGVCNGGGAGRCCGMGVAWTLALIGALNWGVIGLFEFNIVERLFGAGSLIEQIVYIAIGLAGLACLVGCCCKTCKPVVSPAAPVSTRAKAAPASEKTEE